jgi:hypothetical protein
MNLLPAHPISSLRRSNGRSNNPATTYNPLFIYGGDSGKHIWSMPLAMPSRKKPGDAGMHYTSENLERTHQLSAICKMDEFQQFRSMDVLP